jgi:hypothetical protein
MTALGRSGRPRSLGLSALLCFHRLAEPVALAIHLENVAVVGQSVEQCRRHPFPLEDLVPLAERQVRRHQQAASLVAIPEDAEQQLDSATAHRHVPQLVTDQQLSTIQLLQECRRSRPEIRMSTEHGRAIDGLKQGISAVGVIPYTVQHSGRDNRNASTVPSVRISGVQYRRRFPIDIKGERDHPVH